MHKLRRYYYQNKEKIWKTFLLIIFILGIIYFLNDNVGKNENNQNPLLANNNINYENKETNTYISDKSAISGETINKNEVEQINNTISKFLQYCKNGNAEEAYNMLSTDCKKNEYKTLEIFKNNYLKAKFKENDIYEIEKWRNSTYRVGISKDLLATGDIKNKEKTIEYITIVKEKSEEKLNINSLIEIEEIQNTVTDRKIQTTVIKRKTFADYEVYDLKIENLSNKTIKLDSLETTGNIYLEDFNGNRYEAYTNEIIEEELEILPKRRVELSIKFSNKYSLKADISKIVFSKVVLNYNKYKENSEETELYEYIINL